MELLKRIGELLVKTRWGQVLLGLLATLAIGAGTVTAESTEGQAFGYGALGVVLVAAALLGPKAAEKVKALLAPKDAPKP